MSDEQKLLKQRKRALQTNNDDSLAATCASLASLYMEQGRYDFAVDEYKTIAKIYKKQGKRLDFGTANRGIAEGYLELSEYKDALQYLQIYLEITKECSNKLEEQRALASIGYVHLTEYLNSAEKNKQNLHLANRFFLKSFRISQNLDGEVSRFEHADMTARLYLNFGIIEDALGNESKSIEYVNKSIRLCRKHDIHTHLHRSLIFLGNLLERAGDYDSALKQYNSALEVAEKLKSTPTLLSTTHTSIAFVLVRLGEFESARNALLNAYKLKIANVEDQKAIENNLRVVEDMRRTQLELITTVDPTDYATVAKLYEKLADGACIFKCYDLSIDYYHKTITAARNCPSTPPADLATLHNSLAQTYKDHHQHPSAVEHFNAELALYARLKDKLNALSSIADTMEHYATQPDICAVYRRAIDLCRAERDRHEEGRMVRRFAAYSRRADRHAEAYRLELELAELGYVSSDSGAESGESGPEPQVGAGIRIDELLEAAPKAAQRSRRPAYCVKRNEKGESPLHRAAISGNRSIVEHLLEQGHPVDVKDNCGWRPLHEASNYGHIEIVRVLIEHGAELNARGDGGVTALHDAACNGHLKVVQLLLDRGANAIAKNDRNQTVLDMLNCYKDDNELDSDGDELFYELSNRISCLLDKAGVTSSPARCVQNRKLSVDSNSNSSIETVAQDYQRVMADLGSKTVVGARGARSGVKRAALIAEEELVDDWLDDDVKKMVKRTKSSPVKRRSIDSEMEMFEFGRKKKRKRQVSLISSGFSRIVRSPERRIQGGGVEAGKRTQQVKLTEFGGIVEADSTSRTVEAPSSGRIEATVAVDVKIDGKLFRVPVLLSKVNELTIKWLGDEAAVRYARKEFISPTLELETETGAILSDDDPLSLLFPLGGSKAELVFGRIVKYNLQSISKRYTETCEHLQIDENAKITKALNELRICLSLENGGLNSRNLSPLCSALNRQTNLFELNLSGNYLGLECLKLLAMSCTSLESLQKLNLNGTGLTSDCLLTFGGGLGENALRKLTELDLGGNSLGDRCFNCVREMCGRWGLKLLNLSLNEFTRCCFEGVGGELDLGLVEVLDVSDNRFDNACIRRILRELRPQVVKKLSISRNELSGGLLHDVVGGWGGNGLRALEAAHCQVQDSDLYCLISNSAYLTDLDLSYNSDLTCISLNRAIESKLVNIQLLGCSRLFRHFTDFTEFVYSPCLDQAKKSLKISIASHDAENGCDYLIRKWMEWYGDQGLIEKTSNLLVLTTSN